MLPPYSLIWSVSLPKCRIIYWQPHSLIIEVALNTEMPGSHTIIYGLLLFAFHYIISFHPIFEPSGRVTSGITYRLGYGLSYQRLLVISISTFGHTLEQFHNSGHDFLSFHTLLKSTCIFDPRGGAVVAALRYKPAGREFDSRWCHWNFSLT
jgi:hypothetical protein